MSRLDILLKPNSLSAYRCNLDYLDTVKVSSPDYIPDSYCDLHTKFSCSSCIFFQENISEEVKCLD